MMRGALPQPQMPATPAPDFHKPHLNSGRSNAVIVLPQLHPAIRMCFGSQPPLASVAPFFSSKILSLAMLSDSDVRKCTLILQLEVCFITGLFCTRVTMRDSLVFYLPVSG